MTSLLLGIIRFSQEPMFIILYSRKTTYRQHTVLYVVTLFGESNIFPASLSTKQAAFEIRFIFIDCNIELNLCNPHHRKCDRCIIYVVLQLIYTFLHIFRSAEQYLCFPVCSFYVTSYLKIILYIHITVCFHR